ncbi:LOW QUALITY PROTEIN: uncharacterized protein LOC143240523 [Tachypleus tridentatus]|uniref:LOW QUALITY PROTEIN: uncharacterized protein LOC143240523 n=1 Tax=Tachypleus tridentatus TaxID=6853 RepID=UPI003FD0D123
MSRRFQRQGNENMSHLPRHHSRPRSYEHCYNPRRNNSCNRTGEMYQFSHSNTESTTNNGYTYGGKKHHYTEHWTRSDDYTQNRTKSVPKLSNSCDRYFVLPVQSQNIRQDYTDHKIITVKPRSSGTQQRRNFSQDVFGNEGLQTDYYDNCTRRQSCSGQSDSRFGRNEYSRSQRSRKRYQNQSTRNVESIPKKLSSAETERNRKKKWIKKKVGSGTNIFREDQPLFCFKTSQKPVEKLSIDSDKTDAESVISESEIGGLSSENTSCMSESENSASSDSESVSIKSDDMAYIEHEENENKNLCSINTHYQNRQIQGSIGVFWDIENCPVPASKSAADIVCKIRNKLYEGLSEFEVMVACDVTKLSNKTGLVEELNAAHVTVLHVSSRDKNTSDNKIKISLRNFGELCRNKKSCKGSCIVLISGDSDFSSDLQFLRYKLGIRVVLIHNEMATRALLDIPNVCLKYCDFVKDLPDRQLNNEDPVYVHLRNLPTEIENGKLIAELSKSIKGTNGRLKTFTRSEACVQFFNVASADRLVKRLNGQKMFGNVVQATLESSKTDLKTTMVKRNEVKSGEKTKESNSKALEVTLQKGKNVKQKGKNEMNNTSETTVIVEGEEKIVNCDILKSYLEHNLKQEMLSLDFVDAPNKKGIILFCRFKSLRKAKKAASVLNTMHKKGLCDFQVKCIVKKEEENSYTLSSEITTKIANLFQFIQRKKEDILVTHNKEVRNAQIKHQELRAYLNSKPQSVNTAEYSKTAEEIFAVEANVKQLKEQEEEFSKYIKNKLDEVSCVELSSATEIDNYVKECRRNLGQEVCSLQEGLPIYGRKNEILKTINEKQVSILLAETGSGKSTQIVQYLWRSGMFPNKKIVCTQPRKIAAISLAKHVSGQLGFAIGNVVGYQVGTNSKRSTDTRILFMTDHTLLNNAVTDHDFSEYGCIIIDEAHERSIFTDVLLGVIKHCLPRRQDLRVVITSATIDPAIFKRYFGVHNKAVLNIPGRTFPVELEWKDTDVTDGWNYLTEAVNKALQVHLKEPLPGDILTFLTSPVETEKAVNLFQERMVKENKGKDDFLCLQVHGKQNIEDQQKVFKPAPTNKRKIIFATNCAETSVTINGIIYVIDSGMVKEMQYSPKTNASALVVCFVSKSAAEQRKGRAGRTQPGKCIRLFSKNDFENMNTCAFPEILRTNVSQALLKIMEVVPGNPLLFDFVESPPRASLKNALNHLKHLQAVENDELTSLGKYMAKFPLDPSLSKLVVEGISHKFCFDAITVACLVTVSQSLFFRIEENKNEADMKKTQFCQSDGDFSTSLSVYKEWVGFPKKLRPSWCVSNCINNKALNIANELIEECIRIIKTEFDITVIKKFCSSFDFVEKLQSCILESFANNLCVFSGHPKMGYFTLSQEQIHIHPSSSIHYLYTDLPQFIVYGNRFKTTRDFALIISVVSEELISKLIQRGKLQIDLETLKGMTIQPKKLGPIGRTLMLREVLGKKQMKMNMFKNRVKSMTETDFIYTEWSLDKGIVLVFIANQFHSLVEKLFYEMILEPKRKLKEEDQEISFADFLDSCSSSSFKIIIGSGAEVKCLLMPNDFRTIIISKISDGVKDADIISHVTNLENLCSYRLITKGKQKIYVTFDDPKNASKALNKLKHCPDISITPLVSPDEHTLGSKYKVVLNVLWQRRLCKGFGFVNFSSPEEFCLACRLLSGGRLMIGNMAVKVNKKRTDSFYIQNISKLATKESVLQSLQRAFGKLNMDVILIRDNPYVSDKEECKRLENELSSILCNYTCKNSITIQLQEPKEKDVTWKAKIFFKNPADGEQVVRGLGREAKIGPESIPMSLSLQMTSLIFCSFKIYEVVQSIIKEDIAVFKDIVDSEDSISIDVVKTSEEKVKVVIKTNNLKDLDRAQNLFSKIIKGDQINCSGKPCWRNYFLHHHNVIKSIESRTNTYIQLDNRSKTISIFGSEGACTRVKCELQRILDTMETYHFTEFKLCEQNCPKGLLKELVKTYGYNLSHLIDICGLESAEVNFQKRLLLVAGTSDAVTSAGSELEHLKTSLYKTQTQQHRTDAEEMCPVCLDTADPKTGQRLECCGHLYCKECLRLQVESKQIPFLCSSEGCGEPFVLEDLKHILNNNKKLRKDVTEAALKELVQSNSEKYRYCPTSDCPVVYRVSPNQLFICDVCENEICASCHVINHRGMTCELYKALSVDEDYSLKIWMEEKPDHRKLCTQCKAPIEKNGGCNHMTCWNCRSHLCWLCMRTFPSGHAVDQHQPHCSANLGL